MYSFFKLIFLCVYFIHITDACTTPAGQPGSCVPFRSCPSLRRLLQAIKLSPKDQREREIINIRRSLCGSFDGKLRICCPVTEAHDRGGNSHGIARPVSNRRLPAFQNRNAVCGRAPLSDRIINGRNADIGEYPWAGLVIGSVGGSPDTYFCGATLISERFAITAAHCLVNTNAKRVRLGEHTISQSRDCDANGCAPPVQEVQIQRFHVHPEYNRPCSQCNDIALLEFAQPAVIDSNYVSPICLSEDTQKIVRHPNAIAVAIGWGSTLKGARSNSADVLQEVELPLRPLDFCRRHRALYPDPRMIICAGGTGRDTCRGDSGGPLMVTNQFGNIFQIVGITSTGPTFCGTGGTQGIYTSVDYYLPWIRQITGL